MPFRHNAAFMRAEAMRLSEIAINAQLGQDRRLGTEGLPDWAIDEMSRGRLFISGNTVAIKIGTGLLTGKPEDWLVSQDDGSLSIITAESFNEHWQWLEEAPAVHLPSQEGQS